MTCLGSFSIGSPMFAILDFWHGFLFGFELKMSDLVFWQEALGLKDAPRISSSNRRNTSAYPVNQNGIGVGCIIWLPYKKASEGTVGCVRGHYCPYPILGNGGFNHPAVIIKVNSVFGGTAEYSVVMASYSFLFLVGKSLTL
jgi:hypothetical protein